MTEAKAKFDHLETRRRRVSRSVSDGLRSLALIAREFATFQREAGISADTDFGNTAESLAALADAVGKMAGSDNGEITNVAGDKLTPRKLRELMDLYESTGSLDVDAPIGVEIFDGDYVQAEAVATMASGHDASGQLTIHAPAK